MTERLVVIGGDAAGMAGASQAKKRRPDLDVIALEKGRWTSYSACGIPYVVGGTVDGLEDLVARTPEEHRANGIDARTRHEAMALDLDQRRVEVRDHEGERTYSLDFDILHIGTGSRPLRPDLPGIDDEHIPGVQTLEDGAHLLDHFGRGVPEGGGRAVVVGGGYIGLEMAEAFLQRGWKAVTVVEQAPEVMGTLDPDMGALVSEAMRDEGIDVRCSTKVTGFERGVVHTDGGAIEHDLVVLGLGAVPNTALAEAAGLELGPRKSIAVDRRQRTSADGVWAAGDCAESYHLVTNRKVYVALGTVANKQSRVAGINIAGQYATFPGVVGTAVTKVCDTEVARTGLTEQEADRDGFGYETATIESTTRAGYFPGTAPITVKLLAEKRSGRLLGGQIVGEEGAAKRIDVLATALHARMSVEDMTHLDLSYAPPFAPVWDPVLVAARVAAGNVVKGGPQ